VYGGTTIVTIAPTATRKSMVIMCVCVCVGRLLVWALSFSLKVTCVCTFKDIVDKSCEPMTFFANQRFEEVC
jgi:hypothetical protein